MKNIIVCQLKCRANAELETIVKVKEHCLAPSSELRASSHLNNCSILEWHFCIIFKWVFKKLNENNKGKWRARKSIQRCLKFYRKGMRFDRKHCSIKEFIPHSSRRVWNQGKTLPTEISVKIPRQFSQKEQIIKPK